MPLSLLYQSLNQRKRPEDVAEWIIDLLNTDLSKSERGKLEKAAKGSLRRGIYGYTSMKEDFLRPVGMQRQVSKANDIFHTAYPLDPAACDDPEQVEDLIRHISDEIHKTFGRNDFKYDRLNHALRKETGLDISRRRYNKLFRHLQRMEDKLRRMIQEWRKYQFTRIGKTALAHKLSWDEFSKDQNTAAFIAYFTARSNLRSEFTIYGQQKPFDEIAEMLYKRCKDKTNQTNWWAIAHVFPIPEVLNSLTPEQKGSLLGQWYTILQDISGLLEEVWKRSNIQRDTMVVKRGDDSSTWNNTANAWNKARQNWIGLVHALGMETILDTLCPGKVMRLMAADVVAWSFAAGKGLDPSTFVWNQLPLPWEVLSGKQVCTRQMIESACKKHKIDPIRAGWTFTPPPGRIVPFKPTPELVHGVSVSNPYLADLLREAGFFSGKASYRAWPVPWDGKLHDDVLKEHHQHLTDDENEVE